METGISQAYITSKGDGPNAINIEAKDSIESLDHRCRGFFRLCLGLGGQCRGSPAAGPSRSHGTGAVLYKSLYPYRGIYCEREKTL